LFAQNINCCKHLSSAVYLQKLLAKSRALALQGKSLLTT